MASGRRGHRRIVVGILAIAASALGTAASDSLPESYVEAQALGRGDESDPTTVDFHRNVLLPEFSARYQALLRDCQAVLPQPDQTPFSFVAAIGSDGTVLRLWSDRTPPVYTCVRGRLLFERFSPPPRSPFYLYIHMRFTK